MLGTSGMIARVYDDPLDTSDPSSVHRFTDLGVDAQYQYLLDPHSVTVRSTPAIAIVIRRLRPISP